MKKLKKLPAVALSVALLFVLTSCTKPLEEANNPNEDARPVFAAEALQSSVFSESIVITVNKQYTDVTLLEKLEQNRGKDVLYRVIVEALECMEDLELGVSARDRFKYAKSLLSTNPTQITATSDVRADEQANKLSFIAELSEKELDLLIEKGGYSLRLAPPQRLEGYDVKISDMLTVMLDKNSDEELFDVAVVLTIDKTNKYMEHQGVLINQNYNSELFVPLEISSNEEQLNQNAYYAKTIDEYINRVVERNGLSEARQNEKYPINCFVGNFSPEETTAGFRVVATKTEILSLAKDKDVKVIYPMLAKPFVPAWYQERNK